MKPACLIVGLPGSGNRMLHECLKGLGVENAAIYHDAYNSCRWLYENVRPWRGGAKDSGASSWVESVRSKGMAPHVLNLVRDMDVWERASNLRWGGKPEPMNRDHMERRYGFSATDPDAMVRWMEAQTHSNMKGIGELEGVPVRQVSYEACILNPDGMARALCRFLDLPERGWPDGGLYGRPRDENAKHYRTAPTPTPPPR